MPQLYSLNGKSVKKEEYEKARGINQVEKVVEKVEKEVKSVKLGVVKTAKKKSIKNN